MFLNQFRKQKKTWKNLTSSKFTLSSLFFSYRLFIEVIWAKERTFSVHHFSRGVRWNSWWSIFNLYMAFSIHSRLALTSSYWLLASWCRAAVRNSKRDLFILLIRFISYLYVCAIKTRPCCVATSFLVKRPRLGTQSSVLEERWYHQKEWRRLFFRKKVFEFTRLFSATVRGIQGAH